jgi:hypothetical protein
VEERAGGKDRDQGEAGLERGSELAKDMAGEMKGRLQRIMGYFGRLRANQMGQGRKVGESLPDSVVAISAARVRRGDERR